MAGGSGRHFSGDARPAGGFGRHARRRAPVGFSLVETLCVVAIIAILAGLLLPVLARAYSRVKGFSENFEAPSIMEMVTTASRRYCAATPQFRFANKSDFLDKCRLTPKCRSYVEAASTEFVPFDFRTATNLVVLTFHLGRNHATVCSFTKAYLSENPSRR